MGEQLIRPNPRRGYSFLHWNKTYSWLDLDNVAIFQGWINISAGITHVTPNPFWWFGSFKIWISNKHHKIRAAPNLLVRSQQFQPFVGI